MNDQYGVKNYLSTGIIYLVSILSGGCAGMAVDVALFPLDTIKTRIQVYSF
jgi:hypothetical protein